MTEWLPALAKRDLSCAFCTEPIMTGDVFTYDLGAKRGAHIRCLSGRERLVLAADLRLTHRSDNPYRSETGKSADAIGRIADSLEKLVELFNQVKGASLEGEDLRDRIVEHLVTTHEMSDDELKERIAKAMAERTTTVDPKAPGAHEEAAADFEDYMKRRT